MWSFGIRIRTTLNPLFIRYVLSAVSGSFIESRTSASVSVYISGIQCVFLIQYSHALLLLGPLRLFLFLRLVLNLLGYVESAPRASDRRRQAFGFIVAVTAAILTTTFVYPVVLPKSKKAS